MRKEEYENLEMYQNLYDTILDDKDLTREHKRQLFLLMKERAIEVLELLESYIEFLEQK